MRAEIAGHVFAQCEGSVAIRYSFQLFQIIDSLHLNIFHVCSGEGPVNSIERSLLDI